ncbi:MAG: cation diffusion facilitator family transporter [Lachnospiraceae bacterium]|nr:cation diffusion facilitator family transporter [Lachnospiraceae bacterium]
MISRNKKSENEHLAMRVSVNTIFVNLLLSVLKLAAGVLAHSGAMLSDGVHSASDVLSTLVVMVGVKLSGRASDKNHPYGHERLERVAAIILSLLLGVTGVGIGYSGIEKIAESLRGALTIETPGLTALIVAVISIAVKEGMYWYTRAAAKRIHSGAMMADAWHHRSDALSSVGSFIGILGARLGYPILDPAASLVICLFILKAAADIFLDAVRKMTDESCGDEVMEQMRHVILAQDGVLGIDLLRTRMFGARIYVDVEICADGEKTLRETHRIAEKVHHAIEGSFEEVKHCMVHVNPDEEKDAEGTVPGKE